MTLPAPFIKLKAPYQRIDGIDLIRLALLMRSLFRVKVCEYTPHPIFDNDVLLERVKAFFTTPRILPLSRSDECCEEHGMPHRAVIWCHGS